MSQFRLQEIGYSRMILNGHNGPDSFIARNDGSFWDPFLKVVYDRYLTKNSIVIDGGANSGLHTLYLATLCKTVHSFEPATFTYYQLCGNIFLNHAYNVYPYNLALSNENGNIDLDPTRHFVDYNLNRYHFNYGSGDPSGAEFIKKEDGVYRSVTLDSMNLGEINFIKLDVQGNEKNALNGSIETIKKYRPIIAFETERGDFFSEFFSELNYEVDCLSDKTDYLARPR